MLGRLRLRVLEGHTQRRESAHAMSVAIRIECRTVSLRDFVTGGERGKGQVPALPIVLFCTFSCASFLHAAASHLRGPCAVGMRPLSVDIRWGIVLTVLVDGRSVEQV